MGLKPGRRPPSSRIDVYRLKGIGQIGGAPPGVPELVDQLSPIGIGGNPPLDLGRLRDGAFAGQERPHLSAVMVPGGAIRARVVTPDRCFDPVAAVTAVGNSIREWREEDSPTDTIEREHSIRTAQVFGTETTRRLARLSIGVVGCSGTGSWVVGLLARMGVAEIVLVDPDRVEHLNLNRILHATVEDALASRGWIGRR
jgi:hypothetical protein